VRRPAQPHKTVCRWLGKGPLPESASMMLGIEKELRVFQAEEDAIVVVCAPFKFSAEGR
jgi:hypothetical protein